MRKWLLLLLLCAVWVRGAEKPQISVAFLEKEPTVSECREGVDRAVDYILRNCNKYGQFEYRRNINPDKKYSYKYNLLRHCGTIYALGMAWDRTKDPKIAEAIARSCKYLSDQGFIGKWPGARDAVAIWEIPGKLDAGASPGEAVTAKLGGAGLGVLAFMANYRANGKGLETAQKLGRFILSLQRVDGSFICKVEAGNIRDTGMTSLYYPGEAMLGMMRLYEVDGDSKWLFSVARGLQCFAFRRRVTKDYPPDHWILLASAEFLKHFNKLKDSSVTRKEIIEHAEGICRGMLAEQLLKASVPLEYGSFRLGGFTCPTATRCEGMIAALPIVSDEKMKKDIRKSLSIAVNFLLRSQIKEGNLSGGMPRTTYLLPLIVRDAQRVNRRMDEIRIDYVQHSLSAMEMFADLIAEEKQK